MMFISHDNLPVIRQVWSFSVLIPRSPFSPFSYRRTSTHLVLVSRPKQTRIFCAGFLNWGGDPPLHNLFPFSYSVFLPFPPTQLLFFLSLSVSVSLVFLSISLTLSYPVELSVAFFPGFSSRWYISQFYFLFLFFYSLGDLSFRKVPNVYLPSGCQENWINSYSSVGHGISHMTLIMMMMVMMMIIFKK